MTFLTAVTAMAGATNIFGYKGLGSLMTLWPYYWPPGPSERRQGAILTGTLFMPRLFDF